MKKTKAKLVKKKRGHTMAEIKVIRGSVVEQDTDAIVNAANDGLWAGGGVCGAIFKAAGERQLQAACNAIGGCATGQAVATPGFKLKARYIIHAVGPVYHSAPEDAVLLTSVYRSCLERAEELELRSIAFCSISTGIYGYPLEEAAGIAMKTLREFPTCSLEEILFCCFSGHEYDVYSALVK